MGSPNCTPTSERTQREPQADAVNPPIAAVGDALSRHVKLVTAVRPFAPPPPEWYALVKRLQDFRAQGASPLRDKLIDVIVRGGADEARISEFRS